MKIDAFQVEQWLTAYETKVKYNITKTSAVPVTLEGLFQMMGEDLEAFWRDFSRRKLSYGDIEGNPDFLRGVCGLYRTLSPKHIIPTHGTSGANHLLISAVVEPGDHVISVKPTYQQLYSIPASLGAKVDILHLRRENNYLPDLCELRSMVTEKTKLICINNPDNPTGSLMDNAMLREVVEIARSCGAYLLSDEVYLPMRPKGVEIDCIADLYEKGASTCSMSKAYSLAGLRIGWIATKNEELLKACASHREYTLISCGLFDEAVAALALSHVDKLLEKNLELIAKNLPVVDRWVANEPHISYLYPQAGTTALLHYDMDIDSFTFCRRLMEETGTFMVPGDCFDEPKSLRLGFAIDPEVLQAGLAELHGFLTQF
ncbi:aminotransferase [Oscillibacter hominis]|uniref:Aminotransferase n=1 Tax=Oscillibacter hominis TaxID=2763056 RepID=A0A7G9B320_9FIRM|nr:aminotransferase [Oscillibacter hominis]QNL43951.1 aminotransferase [Oscillibacter hominis]